MKRIFTIFIVVILASEFYPQEKNYNKGLLWEISGNGLQKPSYLFGTIHTSQEKYFDLSDSVFIAIESAESFAGELNMDSLQYFVLKIAQRESKANAVKISEILDSTEYEILKAKLKEKFDLDIEDLQTQDPGIIAMILEKEEFKGSMPCFLDEFLYKIAKTRSKAIYGIENLDDQLNLVETLTPDQQRDFLLHAIKDDELTSRMEEKLFLSYLNDDLNLISEILSPENGLGTEIQEKFIFKRNIKMAEKISKYAREKPVFAAVGAAHLPGEKGIISLLEKKGYKLRPVQRKLSGLSEKYKKEIQQEEWVVFEPETGGFSVEMPGKANPLPLPNQIPGVKIEAGYYVELGPGINYIAAKYSFPIKINEESRDSFFYSMIDRMKLTDYDLKEVQYDNIWGKEFNAALKNIFVTGRIFFRGNNVYMLQFMHTKKEENTGNMDHFFKSFKLKEEIGSKDLTGYFTDETGAFKIKFGKQPYFQFLNGGALKMFSAPDESYKAMHMVLYNDQYVPSFYSNDSTKIRSLAAEIIYSSGGKIEYFRKLESEYPFYEYKIVSGRGTVVGRALIRGSRIYSIAVNCYKVSFDSLSSEAFLNSFELTDYKPLVWQEYRDPENCFSVETPGRLHMEPDTLGYEVKYQTVYSFSDSTSGSVYKLMKLKFSPYYWPVSDSSLYSIFFPEYSKTNIVSETDSAAENLKVKDLTLRTESGHNLLRYKLVVSGASAYLLEVSSPQKYIQSERVEPFFSSFKLEKPDTSDLYSDKTEIFFGDLSSNDSLKAKNAALYCSRFNFKDEHAERLYKLLNKIYPDDNNKKGIRSSLLKALKSVKDNSKAAFIENLYPGLSGSPLLQANALEVLSNMKSAEASAVFLKLIVNQTPVDKQIQYYSLFSPFYDSLSNLSLLFPGILKVLKYDDYKSSIYGLLSVGIDSFVIKPEQYSGYESEIINDCRKLIAEKDSLARKGKYFSEWELTDIISTFPGFGQNPQSLEILEALAGDSSMEISSASVFNLIKMNKEVSEDKIEKIAAEPELRIKLYTSLNRASRPELFPPQYLNQQSFAEADFYGVISSEGEGIDSAVLLDTLTNDEGIFYLYKFKEYEEDNYWYVGISGPQPVNNFTIKGKKTKTNYNLLENMTLEEHWNNLLREETEEVYE